MSHACIDSLEPRRLLSRAVEGALPSDALATTIGISVTAAPSTTAAAGLDAQVDAGAVRDGLIRFVDTWNGGQAGRDGTSGMGAYASTWDGLFRMNLDRQFNRVVNTSSNDMSIVSQARAIYINAEAHWHAPGAAEQARFQRAVQKGADYLLAKAVDPNTYNGKPGGMWWGLQSDGVSPPTHTTAVGGIPPCQKDAYGQVHAILALAHAYAVTGDVDHLDGAFKQLDAWKGQFADTAAGPGAYLQSANENFTQRIGTRNLNYMMHGFESLLALHRATPASDPRRAGLSAQVSELGEFITTRMYREAAGGATAYMPTYYDAQWNPSSDPGQRFSDPGHDLQVALLLSRAVEDGFNPAWLNAANKLLAHGLTYGFDNAPASPTYGAVIADRLAFDGTRFGTSPKDLVWWQTAEAARAALHFAVVRGRTDLWDEYEAASAFIRNRFVDPVYGGWFMYVNPDTLAPPVTDKGTVWTGGYHEAMLDAERLRLFPPPPPAEVVTRSAAADTYVRDGSYAGQNFGAAGELQVKKDGVGWARESYLTFSLEGLTAASSARLRLFGKLQSTIGTAVPVAVYGGASTSWSEADLTWTSRPPAGAIPLATANLPDSTGRWYEWDVSGFVRDQLAQGKTAATLVLKTAQTGTAAVFNSDEAASNTPQLVLVTSAGGVTPTPPPAPVPIRAAADAYVRDGAYAGQTFGAASDLIVKRSANLGNTRQTYLRFSLAGVTTVGSAKLRLFGRSSTSAQGVGVALYPASNLTWAEGGLTWNNKPASAAATLASKTIAGTTAAWYEWDVTTYLQQQEAAGAAAVTLVLKATGVTDAQAVFTSDEAAVNRPALIIAR